MLDTAHHDQAPNTGGAHDQFLADIHLANFMAAIFSFVSRLAEGRSFDQNARCREIWPPTSVGSVF